MNKIPLIKPYISQKVKDKVGEVLDSGYLTEGAVTKQFEQSFINYVDCKYALATTSCTTGLEMALRVLGVGPGDEIIVPDYTYPATADVVAIIGATAVIVDVNPKTMLINEAALEAAINEKTKAVIPVSIFGNPLNYEKLNQIKEKHNLFIIEDAACSIGAEYNRQRVGNLADISVFSFHPRKFITTGEGGMITTNNKKWAEWLWSYKHFGMDSNVSRGKTNFVRVGTNYKMSDVLAAVGLVQMECINELLDQRKRLAANYTRLLRDVPKIQISTTTAKGSHSYQSFCVFTDKRDKVLEYLRLNNIEAQIGTYSLHMHKAFNDNPLIRLCGDMKGSKYAYEHCLVLPMYHEMTETDQIRVIETLIASFK